MMSQLISERGHFLFGAVPSSGQAPTLTVEAYSKWYELYLMKPGGDYVRIGFDRLEKHTPDGQSPYVDHNPNPNAVMALANAEGWELNDLAYELIAGRWYVDGNGWPPIERAAREAVELLESAIPKLYVVTGEQCEADDAIRSALSTLQIALGGR